jgi:rhamnulokinase
MTSTTSGPLAAIDLGATSGRVILGHVGPDTLKTETVARFPNTPVRTPDALHWDILHLYGAATAGLRDLVRREPGLRSVGIDSWAVDYGLMRKGALLGNPIHYRDERSARGVRRVHSRFTHRELFVRNGLQFLPFNTLYQLAAEDDETLALADRLLLIPDLFAYWLTGEQRAESTNASTTGLIDVHTGFWDLHLLDELGLRRALLPDLVSPGQAIGELSAPVAAALGARTPIPVTAVGSHDTASAVVAVPMSAQGAAYISCGTWGLVGVEVSSPVVSPAALAGKFTNEAGVDGRVRLLRNVMGLWILSETIRGWEAAGHSVELPALLSAARDVPARSVPVFDVDDPRFLPPGDMIARIDAWCDENSLRAPRTQAEYARSIIESLASAFAATAHTAADLAGTSLSVIHVVGGGALNELLCQRTADVAGVPVVAGPVEATALGNLLVQARAARLLTGSLESLRDLVIRTQHPRSYAPLV